MSARVGAGPVTETRDIRLKKLRLRAWRRGTREADLILGAFADAHLGDLDDARLSEFEALLDAPDQDVYNWLVGREPPPPAHDTELFALVKSFRFFARTAAGETARGA